jgi:osmotically-inducible protein OsmY
MVVTMQAARPSVRPSALDLRAAIDSALWAYDPLRANVTDVDIDVDGQGVVTAKGWVRSRSIKQGVLRRIRDLPDVTGVIDRLISDPDLETEIAWRLALDPRAGQLPPGAVHIHCQAGNALLAGVVPSEEMRKYVKELAGQVEGVRQVIDRLSLSD